MTETRGDIMGEIPSFDAFYRAVNGRDPFPWQRRLADEVARSRWPKAIGIPTGLGKTSCLDVAVWAMAAEGERPGTSRVQPTRIWYVVNRRLLVDAAYDHGQRIAALMADPNRAADDASRATLAAVADALGQRRGGAANPALYVTRLRGGADLGARPPDPSQPAVVFATVPMFASRWLFRGYGTSATMRPVDAALAGTDSLVLLDEAHLVRNLLALEAPLRQCDVGDPAAVLGPTRSRPQLVSLSATLDDTQAFLLDDADQRHPVVHQRLTAAKPVEIVPTSKTRLVRALAQSAEQHLADRPPTTAVVFVNSPVVAREVFETLDAACQRRSKPLQAEVVLLTGRMREREAATVRRGVLDPTTGARAGRDRLTPRTAHLIVVATQTLEVGADLDFDVLVTEACGARALIQRLGRLNRLGDSANPAGSIIFAKDAKTFGIYGDEPFAVITRLQEAAVHGMVDLGPRYVNEIVGAPADATARAGELLPAHLWEWAKTTNAPPGEAPPELFFDSVGEPQSRVSILWRAFLPEDGTELRPGVSGTEAVDVPIGEAREALTILSGVRVARLAPDRVTVERNVELSRLRPGDLIVLPVDAGGYDAHGWAPGKGEEVLDVSLLRSRGLPLTPPVLDQLFGVGEDLTAATRIAKMLVDPPDPDEADERAAMAEELVDHLRRAGPSLLVTAEEWQLLSSSLRPQITYELDEPGRLVLQVERGGAERPQLRSDVFDELSFTATSAVLTEHLGSVGELAARIARALGLPSELVAAVEAAGRFHDLGKFDVRFQRWLDPTGQRGEPVAKSSAPSQRWERDRIAAGWPRGGRHEELSRRLVEAYLDDHAPAWDADLVVHLVVSHHGFARPLIHVARDLAPTTVTASVAGTPVTVSGDLSAADWMQPARFRRCCERYGYWGLALLEAIVRQADHEVSAVVVA